MIEQIEQVDKGRLLEDFKALLTLNKRFIHRSLYHKIQELKVTLATGQYTEEETLNPHTDQKRTDNPSKGIKFNIHRIGKMWIPSIPDFPDINPFSVLPVQLVDYVAQSAEGGLIALKKPIQVKGHNPIKISFQMHSNSFIDGVLEEMENVKGPNLKDDDIELIDIEGNQEDDLKTFLQYFLSNDAFTAYIVREFYIRWKPLIDAGCIEFPRQINAM